jgi:hypothetical protein
MKECIAQAAALHLRFATVSSLRPSALNIRMPGQYVASSIPRVVTGPGCWQDRARESQSRRCVPVKHSRELVALCRALEGRPVFAIA